VSQKYWAPSETICVDDDLEKCEASTTEKIHIARKA
jgi:hypothetical protein